MTFVKELTGQWIPALKRYVFVETAQEYEGPVAYAFGPSGGGGGTEVVPTGPFGPQIPFVMRLFNEAENLLNQGPPQFPDFSTVADPNQTLQQSQAGIQDFVQGQSGLNQGLINTAAGAAGNAGNNPVSTTANPLAPNLQQGIMQLLASGNNPLARAGQNTTQGAQQAINTATQGAAGGGTQPNFNPQGLPQLSGAGVDIAPTLEANLSGSGLNPFIDETVQAATRSLQNNFQRNILPSIGDAGAAAGQFGGTRQGVAEGIAAGDLQQNVADVTSQLFAQGFDRNVQAQQNALALGGQLQAQQGQLGLQGAGLAEEVRRNVLGQALQGADLSREALQGGLGLGQSGVATGTSQAGNLLQAGNAQRMQELFGALGLVPSLQGNQLAQLGALNQSGLQQQGFQQSALDDEVNRFFFEQFAPFNALTQFQNFIGGSFGSSVAGAPNNFNFPGVPPGPNTPTPNPGAQPASPPFPPLNPFQPFGR